MSNLMQVIDGTMTQAAPEYSKMLQSHGFGLVPDAQLLAAKRQIMKTEFAMKCAANRPDAVLDAIRTAGTLGLDLTEGKRQGWLVPRDGQIAFQIGYKGYEAIYQRIGVIDRLSVAIVYANDEFNWSGDDSEKPTITPPNGNWFDKPARGEPSGAFCVTYFPDGSLQVVTSSVTEIYENHRNKSDSWKNPKAKPYSPWTNHPEEMIKKTMVYIASKQWPASSSEDAQASKVLELLHEAETRDHSEYSNTVDIVTVNPLHTLMMMDDCLGVYLLQKDKDVEEITQLHYWPAELKLKGALKARAEQMRQEGESLLAQINSYLEQEDSHGLYESLELSTRYTRYLLSQHLGDEVYNKIKELLAGIENE